MFHGNLLTKQTKLQTNSLAKSLCHFSLACALIIPFDVCLADDKKPDRTPQTSSNNPPSPAAGKAGDKERVRDESMKQREMQDRNRMHDCARLYGAELMTDEGCAQYRERIRNAKSIEEREQIMEKHRLDMQQKALQKGLNPEDLEPAEEDGYPDQ